MTREQFDTYLLVLAGIALVAAALNLAFNRRRGARSLLLAGALLLFGGDLLLFRAGASLYLVGAVGGVLIGLLLVEIAIRARVRRPDR